VSKQELGYALQRSGDNDSAAAVYEEVIASAPQAHVTRGLLAETRIAQGRVDEAIAIFEAGLSRYSSTPLLHRGLASALERAGRGAEAAAAYREYARLAPGAPDAQELAARAAALEGKTAPTS
jgi:predicted Zn-dependent protease